MKLIAEALILMLILTLAGYGLWRLRLMILGAWRKRRARAYKNTRQSCSSGGR